MSCCRPLRLCNNTATVSPRAQVQQSQRCGQNKVVRRLTVTHRDHILSCFLLIDKRKGLAYRPNQHRLFFYHFGGPCWRTVHGRCVSEWWMDKAMGRRRREQCHYSCFASAYFISWLMTRVSMGLTATCVNGTMKVLFSCSPFTF